MALSKERKKEIVEELKELLKNQKSMVFVNFRGLNAQELFDLREALKEVDSSLKVIKKSLAEISFKKQGIDFNKELFQDQLAIVFGFEDETAPARIVYQQSKKSEPLEILGGYLDNEFLDKEKMIIFAKLPPRQELLARLIYVLDYPIRGFVNVLSGNIKGLIYALQAIANRG